MPRSQTMPFRRIHRAQHQPQTFEQACGTPIEDYAMADNGKEGLVLGVKDVADMLDFDQQQVRCMEFADVCAVFGIIPSASIHRFFV